MSGMTPRQSILIVDDAAENITLLGELLRDDYQVRIATTGQRALEIAASEKPPDLILLDIMMPGMDGYEVCRALKADQRTSRIPVIFITAMDSEEDEYRGFEAGAVDYVTKPFRPVLVKARVKTHLELKRYRDYLEDTSYLDGLTGIGNRRRFDEYLDNLWSLAEREQRPLSLILLDIDHFKDYNDRYGHQEGDRCLIRIAQTLAGTVRRKSDLAARYGGEEFAIILPDVGREDALAIAETIREAVEGLGIPHTASDVSDWVTVSLGVATVWPSPGQMADTMVKKADRGLYAAKAHGRNRVVGIEDADSDGAAELL